MSSRCVCGCACMRLYLETVYGNRIFKDRSPCGVPRYIVECVDGSFQLYSSLYYNLEQIRGFLDE